MKLRNRLPLFRIKCSKWINQKGQTLVEFVLLLAVVSSISYAFVSTMNTFVGKYWTHCVNLVINDGHPNRANPPSPVKQVTLD